MFWGVTLENGKKYIQVVDVPVHISMASLDASAQNADKPVSVMIEHEKSEFVLCTLLSEKLPQQPLDLNFAEGESVTFFLNGQGKVHLTGYSEEGLNTDDESEEGDESEISDSELKEIVQKQAEKAKKRKALNTATTDAKKQKQDVDSDEMEEEDEEEDDDDDDNDDEEDEDDDSLEDIMVKGRKPLKQKGKFQQGKKNQQQRRPPQQQPQQNKTQSSGNKNVAATPKTPDRATTINGSPKTESGKRRIRRNKKRGQNMPLTPH